MLIVVLYIYNILLFMQRFTRRESEFSRLVNTQPVIVENSRFVFIILLTVDTIQYIIWIIWQYTITLLFPQYYGSNSWVFARCCLSWPNLLKLIFCKSDRATKHIFAQDCIGCKCNIQGSLVCYFTLAVRLEGELQEPVNFAKQC